jgi:hypothetical protein
MNETEAEMRRQALQLAISYIAQVQPTQPVSPDSVIDAAQKFYKFMAKDRDKDAL